MKFCPLPTPASCIYGWLTGVMSLENSLVTFETDYSILSY
jgi:hypothetical protein